MHIPLKLSVLILVSATVLPAQNEEPKPDKKKKQQQQAKLAQQKKRRDLARLIEHMRIIQAGGRVLELDKDSTLDRLAFGLECSPQTIKLAVSLLTAMGTDARLALPTLAKALNRLSKPELQLEIVKAMIAIGADDPETIPAYCYQLANSDAATRQQAALALGRLGAEAASGVRNLIWATKDDSHKVRCEAVTALGMIGPSAKRSLPRLRELCKSEDKQTHARAVVALREVSGK